MFGIGTTEIVIILLIALLVLGPDEIPKVARTLGKAMRSIQHATDEIKHTLTAETLEEEDRKPPKALVPPEQLPEKFPEKLSEQSPWEAPKDSPERFSEQFQEELSEQSPWESPEESLVKSPEQEESPEESRQQPDDDDVADSDKKDIKFTS